MTDRIIPDFEITEDDLLILANAVMTKLYDIEVHEFTTGWRSNTHEQEKLALDQRLEEIRSTVGDKAMSKVRTEVQDRFRRQLGDRYWHILKHGSQEEKDKVAEEWNQGHRPLEDPAELRPHEYRERKLDVLPITVMFGNWKSIDRHGIEFRDEKGDALFAVNCRSEKDRREVLERLDYMMEYLRNYRHDPEDPNSAKLLPNDRLEITRIECEELEGACARVSFRYMVAGDYANYFSVILDDEDWDNLRNQLEDFDPTESSSSIW